MRIAFVYEHLFPPFDEGIKIFAHQLHQQYESEHSVTVIRYARWLPNFVNSLLIVPRLLLLRIFWRPEKLVFIPQAALTFSSLVKLSVLRLFYGDRLVAIGVQKRELSASQASLLRRMRFPRIFVLSNAMADPLKAINVDAATINAGIDQDVYRPTTSIGALRERYGIADDKRVLLHVGHIRETRNVHWLLEIKSALPDMEVILVGSTTTDQEEGLYQQLTAGGVRVMRDYLPSIQEIYQLADIYCFPVTLETAAMETPLSVLEAMSTNLPVVTTRFGRLPELFDESPHYHYVNSAGEIVELLKSGFEQDCKNREEVAKYSWPATANRLLA